MSHAMGDPNCRCYMCEKRKDDPGGFARMAESFLSERRGEVGGPDVLRGVREKAVDLKGEVFCVTTTPLDPPAPPTAAPRGPVIEEVMDDYMVGHTEQQANAFLDRLKPLSEADLDKVTDMFDQALGGAYRTQLLLIARLRAALKERDEAQEKECICPACGTEWTSGAPQRCRTTLIAERDAALARAERAEALLAEARTMTEFYANEKNYEDGVPGKEFQNPNNAKDSWWVRDDGARARALLSRIAEKGEGRAIQHATASHREVGCGQIK